MFGVNPADVVAGGDAKVADIGCLLVEVEWGGADPDEQPDEEREKQGHAVIRLQLGEGVGHYPVPLNTQAGDEQNGTVHVAVEETDQDFAQTLSVNPVVPIEVVGDLQRDPDDEEQIGHSQVGHVDGGWVLLLGSEEEDPESHDVGWQTNDEDHDVDDGEEDGGEAAFKSSCRGWVYDDCV